MFFFLRKLIEALLLPFGFAGLLILAAVVLRRRWLALTGVGLVYGLSLTPVSILMVRPLEQTYPPMAVADASHADAIVVLSGSILRGKNDAGVQWGASANRFYGGLDLAAAGKADRLVISAGVDPIDGTILRGVATRAGIAPDRVVVTPLVSTTEDEARAVAKMSGIHSIILVTSAYHMPRAALLFRAHHFDVRPFPTDQRGRRRLIVHSTDFIPTPTSLENSQAAFREYYGLLLYRAILYFHHD